MSFSKVEAGAVGCLVIFLWLAQLVVYSALIYGAVKLIRMAWGS